MQKLKKKKRKNSTLKTIDVLYLHFVSTILSHYNNVIFFYLISSEEKDKDPAVSV